MAKAIAVADEQSNGSGLERIKSQPARLMEFLKDVRAEMRKVVSPSRQEVLSTTTVVVVTVFLFAGYFAIVDYLAGQGITQLITYFAKR